MTEAQKLERFLWCLKHRGCDFNEYIFVDETMVRMSEKPIYHLRLPSQYPKAIPCTSKFASKLNIWGGISSKGPTEFAVNQFSFKILSNQL